MVVPAGRFIFQVARNVRHEWPGIDAANQRGFCVCSLHRHGGVPAGNG